MICTVSREGGFSMRVSLQRKKHRGCIQTVLGMVLNVNYLGTDRLSRNCIQGY